MKTIRKIFTKACNNLLHKKSRGVNWNQKFDGALLACQWKSDNTGSFKGTTYCDM